MPDHVASHVAPVAGLFLAQITFIVFDLASFTIGARFGQKEFHDIDIYNKRKWMKSVVNVELHIMQHAKRDEIC